MTSRWRRRPSFTSVDHITPDDTNEVGQHPAVLGARQRLHAVVGQDRVPVAHRRVPAAAGGARTAADLEGRQHQGPGFEPVDLVAHRHDLGHGLVPEGEALVGDGTAEHEQRVDLAAGDGDRPDERVRGLDQHGVGHLPPGDLARTDARELLHGSELCSRTSL